MTLSDPQRSAVRWAPRPTSVPAIARLTPPGRFSAQRDSPFERQVWTVTLVIERYRMQSNGEIALELYDIPSATYMNAYMPDPSCLPATTRGRTQIIAARNAFTHACAKPPGYWWPLGASVQLSGVGYWNPARTTLGAVGNGAELRPVVGFKLVNGCGKG